MFVKLMSYKLHQKNFQAFLICFFEAVKEISDQKLKLIQFLKNFER